MTPWRISLQRDYRFQSTPPARWWHPSWPSCLKFNFISIHTTRKVVTFVLYLCDRDLMISIHTTRKVVTWALERSYSLRQYFNPHHPQGGDDNDGSVTAAHILFQSTPPARWWLFLMFCCSFHFYFNPHHPQGGDPMRVLLCVGLKFQSTPPARWWLLSIKQVNIVIHFNPHHPQGGDTLCLIIQL